MMARNIWLENSFVDLMGCMQILLVQLAQA
jgi:hypothetical protein